MQEAPLQSLVGREGNLLERMSQEQRNLLYFARFLPWNGRRLVPNDRLCFTFPLRLLDSLLIDQSVKQTLMEVQAVLKRHLETDQREIYEVLFIQENVTSPPPGPGFAGRWHVHFGTPDGAVVHFGDSASTELIEGEIETTIENLPGSALIPAEEVEAALLSGKAKKITLGSGDVGGITDQTAHRRGPFVEFKEPRMAAYIKFNPRTKLR
jgi:hypothetical protein